MGNFDFSTMTMAEIEAIVKQASAAKRDHKAKQEREKIAAIVQPLYDAIDDVIAEDPALRELIEEKDAMRLYFNSTQEVNRDTVRFYAQRQFDGDKGGQKQYKGKAEEIWRNVPNSTWKSAAVAEGCFQDGQSAQVCLNKGGFDTRTVDVDGVITSSNSGK